MTSISRLLKLSLLFVLIFMLAAGVVTAISATSSAQPPAEPQELFVARRATATRETGVPAVVRSRPVQLNLDLLGGPRGEQASVPQVSLNLFADVSLTAIFERREVLPGNGYGWAGRLAGSPYGNAFFVVREGLVVGNIKSSWGAFRVRPAGEGYVIQEIDEGVLPERVNDYVEVELPAGSSRAPAEATDDGGIIDVMVVYTPAAEQGGGGKAAMDALIDLGILETNASYANSNANQRVRLVHRAEVGYSESGDPVTDLFNLRNMGDGVMDIVHTWRDTYGADVVSLWLDLDNVACGVGFVMNSVDVSFQSYAFNVVDYRCATGNYSFGHEMGHNMGMRHDWYVDDGDGSPFSYNHGYTYPDSQDGWRTVMSYSSNCLDQGLSCPRVPYWSNPNISMDGIAMGVPAGTSDSCNSGDPNPDCDADNRLALNNTFLTVANFRQTVVIATVSKSVSDAYVAVGERITYTLTASNQLATSASGIVLTDSVPANTVLDSSTLSVDASSDGTGPGSTIAWTTNQDLAQGQILQRSFSVRTTAAGLITNTAHLSTENNSIRLPSNTVRTLVPAGASCGFAEGFESGRFSHVWQTHATNDGRARVLTDLPRTGTYSAIIDDAVGDSTHSEFGLVLSLNLAGAGTAGLDFYWHDLGDEYNPGYDGVFIREDGAGSWTKVYDFGGENNSSFQAGHIDLETAAANAGLLLTREFQVKFQGFDNLPFYPPDPAQGDGYALDDIELVCSCLGAPTAPTLSISKDDTLAYLSWNDGNDAAGYELWRSSTPYFTPGGASTTLLQESALVDYEDAVIGDGHNAFYLVRAANACGDLSPDSNGTGKFAFALVPGTP